MDDQKASAHDRQSIIDKRLGEIADVTQELIPDMLDGNKDAIASWLRLVEREAKYLDLDSTAKVEVAEGVRYELHLSDD